MDTSGVTLWDSINVGVRGKIFLAECSWKLLRSFMGSSDTCGRCICYISMIFAEIFYGRQYDLGGYDISSKLRTTSDGKLIIMAYGTTTGGSNYVDWQTVKVDTSGNILWQDRYNEH
ncbi:MAG: hypothetical protein IPN61_12890 [Bacteroidetes bacterium]|nr:hypothetical protein [Bacteroidota bacterium]